jgi:hypothetical protein
MDAAIVRGKLSPDEQRNAKAEKRREDQLRAQDEREKLKAERKAHAEQVAEAKKRSQDEADDRAAREIVGAIEGGTTQNMEAAICKALACGPERARRALHRVAVSKPLGGKSHANGWWLL